MVNYMGRSVPKERDPDSGQYTEAVSDEELLGFIEESGGVSTAEVANQFGYERPTAYRRLKDLRREGAVNSRKIGNSLLWMLPDNDENKGR